MASGYGCAEEGGSSQSDCTSPVPLPWTYAACDEAWNTTARQADWCYAFGGTGNAQSCTATEHFTDENIAPVSTNFEHIVHGCETPNLADSGWGQTINGYFCWSGSPTTKSGILTDDFRKLRFSGHSGSTCSQSWTETVYARKDRDLTCPSGYNPVADFCMRTPNCPCHLAGNPTRVGDGQKIEWETDLPPVSGGLLQYKRVYRSGGRFRPYQTNAAIALDDFWESNFDSRLYVLDATLYPVPYVISTPEGTVRYFDASGTEYLHYGRAAEKLTVQRNAANQITGYARTLSDDSVETFTPDGLLARYADTQGHALTLAYDSAAHLQTVTDERNRMIRFEYNSLGQRIAPNANDGARFVYSYDANSNLQTVTYPGGAFRSYRYENTALAHALTGITDENGANFAAYAYDSTGRVQDTRHAPAQESGAIEHYHFGYDTSSTTITGPLGQVVTYTFALAGGVRNLSSLSGPCGSCGEPYASVQYDAAGYFSRATDFNGNITWFSYDDTRGLETSRTEASGSAAQRTIVTQPDSQWRKPALRTVRNSAGAESQTAWQYNARGQVIARCEIDPNDATAAVYTCNRDTTPPTGAAVRRWTYRYCESADISAGTCPLLGLLLSSDGPRSDVSDVTNYAYYGATDYSGCGSRGGQCHAIGDLETVTNALGQVTTYFSYDKNGRITRTEDANGTYIDLSYTLRGWLASRTVRANADGSPNATLDATTSFSYDDAGNVTRVTQSDGAFLHYLYDDAHRLTDVYDSQTPADYRTGNHIRHALDAVGHRIAEQTSDAAGTLKRALSRQYDQLARLTAVLNATGSMVQQYANPSDPILGVPPYIDGYDFNGNAVYSLDGNSIGTEQKYDGLNRLVTVLQDHAFSMSPKSRSGNVTTRYAYDARDNLRSVTDPDGLVTGYTYNGLNNLTNLASPDTGGTRYTYDSAGNRSSQTDARGVTATFRYDALNRLTGISYPTSGLSVTYVYDQVLQAGCYNIGRLSTIYDSTGATTYCYDRRGNVLSKVQGTFEPTSCGAEDPGCGANYATAGLSFSAPQPNATMLNVVNLTTSYAYDRADRLAGITYPSGAIVSYGRDGAGRINAVRYQPNASAAKITLLGSVSYYPFGPANRLTFGNGHQLTKSYDKDYAIASVAGSSGFQIGATVDVLGNLTQAYSTINAATPAQQYVYDPLYRLTTVQDGNANALLTFTYDATGDRTSKTAQAQGAQTYAYIAGTHRLASVGSATRSYDANGNTLSGAGNGTLSYDDRNRQSGWNLVNGQINLVGNSALYGYNGKGERTSKQTMQYAPCAPPTCNPLPGAPVGWLTGTEAFSYDEDGHLLGEYPGKYSTGIGTEYIYLDGTPIALLRSGTLYYIETDQLGTPRTVVLPGTTTSGDTVVWKWDYFANNSAFGENAPSVQGIRFNLRFPGQYYDAETGLNYNYFRDYEPGTGRYVESDRIGLFGGIDTYAYASNNPFVLTDALGLTPCRDCCSGVDWRNGERDFQAATTTCCGGSPVICLNPKICEGKDMSGRPVAYPNDACSIVKTCARKHEGYHRDHHINCSGAPDYTGFDPQFAGGRGECEAYRYEDSLQPPCLNIAQCTSQLCQSIIRAIQETHVSNRNKNCQNAGM